MARLTDKEKIVFYGLVKYPELNDIELAQRIKIKRPTITAIRNRLEKQRLYDTLRMPDITRLGCEMLSVTYTGYNPLTSYKTRRWEGESPNTFFEIQTDTQRLCISAEKNYTEAMMRVGEHIRFNNSHGYAQKRQVANVVFPIGLSVVLMNFEFGPLLRKTFSIKDDVGEIRREYGSSAPVKLNETEKTILYALVKYPELREKEIAEKTNYTRQTVNNINRKLRKEGLLSIVRVPNITKMGLELLVFSRVFMKPVTSMATRIEGASKVVGEGSQVFVVSNLLDSVMLSVSKNYTSVRHTYQELFSHYTQNDFLEKRPEINIFPMKEVGHYKYDYTTITRELLGIENQV